jgi:hypothetical protein
MSAFAGRPNSPAIHFRIQGESRPPEVWPVSAAFSQIRPFNSSCETMDSMALQG